MLSLSDQIKATTVSLNHLSSAFAAEILKLSGMKNKFVPEPNQKEIEAKNKGRIDELIEVQDKVSELIEMLNCTTF